MIPIGTKCIVARSLNGDYVGMVVKVVAHIEPPIQFRHVTCDHEIDIGSHPGLGHMWGAPENWLIPIGHDPDTETRTTDREVTA